jgi:hypothetical protein
MAVRALEFDVVMIDYSKGSSVPPSAAVKPTQPISAPRHPVTTTIQVLGKFVEALGRTNVIPQNRK